MDKPEGSRKRKALIVGAGPVGALTALSLDRRGWEVEIWDAREDPRGKPLSTTNLRSINLAISARGLEALRSVDPTLAEQFLREAIPMKGRMIHHVDGQQESQVYEPIRNQCINSISRPILNQRLVESLPPTVEARFNTKLSRLDLKKRLAWGKHASAKVQPGQEHDNAQVGGEAGGQGKDRKKQTQTEGGEDSQPTAFDLVIGCDGSWSRVRSEMMRVDRVDFSQSFINSAYIELRMPALPGGGWAMDPNHLHIWPRHSYMLIALPNKDGSFTLTLFVPFDSLEMLDTEAKVAGWFRTNFPSAVDIVGIDRLVKDFMANPRGNLVTINVSPSSWSSHALLLGDASHSMVPFYGQGLNCGLEDVRVLNSYLTQHNIASTTSAGPGVSDEPLTAALAEYSTHRAADLRAICDLALQNHIEMQSHVLSPYHHLRRYLDSILSTLIPSQPTAQLTLTDPFPTTRIKGWTSLYEMVTFRPDIGYAEAWRREQWQKGVIESVITAVGVVGAAGLGWAGLAAWRALRR